MKVLGLLLANVLVLSAQTDFQQKVDRFYKDYFQRYPSEGTSAGFHEYDNAFEDFSQASRDSFRQLMARYLDEFQKFPASDDRDLVIEKIRGQLLNVDEIRMWEKDPDLYSSYATASIFSLMSRRFAPPEQRLRSVIARERQFGAMFGAARKNLKNPPRIYTEIALEQLPGMESFFARDVPAAFHEVRDQTLLTEFKASNQTVLAGLRAYRDFLQNELLPRSNGSFPIGAENYRKKLLYEEMVDIPLNRLLKIGYDNLRQNQKQLAEVAKKIDPAKTTQQIADELAADHPPPDQLLNAFRNTFADLKRFIREHRIITIPSDQEPTLEETPPFMRATTTASMDTPGPYEQKATEAYFNVTLPEKIWPARRVEEFMTAFNQGTISSTAIHEAFPGHFTQLLWLKQVNGKVRKLTQSASNVEGWAHYTEQMMLDEGYGNNDPKLRFGQLIDALLRNCRYIVGIEMHTGKMTYEQGINFFMKEAYMTHDYAERETKRGTSDPTYLVYTLGKLQILKLRHDYRQKVGARFSLERFHNEFVKQGGLPISLIRKNMLGDSSASL